MNRRRDAEVPPDTTTRTTMLLFSAATTEPAPDRTVMMEWWSGADDRECGARILDIGRDGATLEADQAPPVGHDVWFHRESPATSPWVHAKVIGHDRPGRVSVGFDAPCPDAVILGFG